VKSFLLLLAVAFVALSSCASRASKPVEPGSAARGKLSEAAPARLSPPVARANALTSTLVELYLPELPFDASAVDRPGLYRVTSRDDSAYDAGVAPTAIDERYWPEQAPYRPAMLATGGDIAEINVIYRVYLTLPIPLQARKTYTLAIDPSVVAVGPLSFQYDAAPTDAIHVNQVAYQTAGPKTAYVSWWTGSDAIAVAAIHFQVVDESRARAVYTGTVAQTLSAPSDPWTRSNVYALDFTSLETPGNYHLEVPGVGRSYSFSISDSAFRAAIGYVVVRGLFMQRDGAGGLDRPNLTHFTRPPAHLSDAIEEWTGRPIDLTGGHMDAGDRGHYPHNSAAACANLLAPTFYFGPQIDALAESLDLPETGNGIPDYVDELTYELDWLAKAVKNTSRDGTLGFALRPGNFGYEVGQPPSGVDSRVFFNKTHGALRSETLYAAGALAMACNSPVLRKYLPPAKLAQYKAAALRAWNGFELHDADSTYWKDGSGWYDPWDPTVQRHMWSDELVFAAANLLEMTGDRKYVARIQEELPPDLDRLRQWGWVTSSPWLHAFLSLANVTDPQLDPVTKQRARAAVLSWAEAEVWKDGAMYDAPFGAPLPSAIKYQVGWFFSNTFASMVAFGLTGDEKYRGRIVRSWNYLLGTNATSRSFFSGLGDPAHRPHWLVHEISDWEVSTARLGGPGGWEDMAPGLPMADVQMGIYPSFFADPWNRARATKQFPAWSRAYPVLYRAIDAWDPRNEFTVATQTAQIASIVPLFSAGGARAPRQQ
jgi:Glycosyl hydrolase family 9/Cellulase N-terminal ig-like domain